MSADDTSPVSRRGFLRAATGAAAASAAAGTATAQEGNSTNTTSTSTSTPGGNGTSTSTASGNESSGSGSGGSSGGGPTEEVAVGPGGNLVFEPAELEIAPGTTVNFVWESDFHNVVPDSIPEDSDWSGTEGAPDATYDTGHEYSYTFEVEGEYTYFCQPHVGAGMEASITVSADAGGGGGGGGGGGPPAIPDSAKTLGIASTIGLVSTLGLAYFLMRYGGDYEQE